MHIHTYDIAAAAILTIVSSSCATSGLHTSLPWLQAAIFPHTITCWVLVKGCNKVHNNATSIAAS